RALRAAEVLPRRQGFPVGGLVQDTIDKIDALRLLRRRPRLRQIALGAIQIGERLGDALLVWVLGQPSAELLDAFVELPAQQPVGGVMIVIDEFTFMTDFEERLELLVIVAL